MNAAISQGLEDVANEDKRNILDILGVLSVLHFKNGMVESKCEIPLNDYAITSNPSNGY